MKTVQCNCGGRMELASILIPGVEEHEDYYTCSDCGAKKYPHEMEEVEAGE